MNNGYFSTIQRQGRIDACRLALSRYLVNRDSLFARVTLQTGGADGYRGRCASRQSRDDDRRQHRDNSRRHRAYLQPGIMLQMKGAARPGHAREHGSARRL